MGQTGEIKFKVLPRKGDKTGGEKPKPEETKLPRMIIYVGTVSLLVLVTLFALPKVKQIKSKPASGQASLVVGGREDRGTPSAAICKTRNWNTKMMVQSTELANVQFKDANHDDSPEQLAASPDTRDYGVQLDADDSADRVYEDLHGEPAHYADTLPDDKINARLANRKWVNEQEREERRAFISNFIRSAYDRGYEVEIDQNLVVVGAHRINTSKKLNIDQVMDRLAKQGL